MLLDLDQGTFFVATGTGPAVWALLVGSTPLGEVSQAVADRYEIDPDSAYRDVITFVNALLERGFIQPISGG